MNHQERLEILVILILISIIASVTVFVNYTHQQEEAGGIYFHVTATQAVETVAQNETARDYVSANFKKPEWRLVKTTLVHESLFDLNGSLVRNDQPYWKVEMMERTCSCGSVKDLYVIEGYVSPDTGELMNVTTGLVSESQYDKQTCATTVCH